MKATFKWIMAAILGLEDIKWSATSEKQLKLSIPVRFELMFHVERLLTFVDLQTCIVFHVEHWSIRFSTLRLPKWEHMSPGLKTWHPKPSALCKTQ